MRKICIINQKGGVAKTTTTINLGAGLARKGKKVLILDIDPQGSIATCLGTESYKDMYDLLVENADWQECIMQMGANLDIIKSKESLTKAETILTAEPSRETYLRRKLKTVKGYDYLLIDCPPSLGLLNQNAILYADEAIIPTSTDVLGYEGLKKIVKAIVKIREVFDHEIKITKIVPTLFDMRNKICKEILEEIKTEFTGMVSEPIRISSKFKEAPRAQKSIFGYAPKSRAATDYMTLVEDVISDEEKVEALKEREQKAFRVEKIAPGIHE
ncbi:ParA family protein [Candidatus Woesearchaeota archaeon]|jgi:chromosome partitioning protein|nr:ParA family protein [Candidatus Woesearchaeota archaeon]MBT3538203.1 ParA family protein [Candidatus Woesearchaeota archaeon]MBT4698463.1 ParA family protein [Candidatus Woesearchaeota archaeon]MBT7105872.1 ParA family protein [Candidatus Woesearchaeota archaeon]MBT7930709.1 ParA family protein [Candidatus Woesearchaeota archaeon]